MPDLDISQEIADVAGQARRAIALICATVNCAAVNLRSGASWNETDVIKAAKAADQYIATGK